MAMVRARRGQRVVKVSKSIYESTYKKLGYMIIGEEKPVTKPVEKVAEEQKEEQHEMGQEQQESEEPEEVKQEEPEEDVDSIPISDMNKAQLMEFAKKHNIDTKAARNVPEARKIIQKAVREKKM